MAVARVLGVALLTGTVVVLAPTPVEACDCSGGPSGGVRWPRDGATEVANDTPIVIWRYFLGGDLDTISYELADESGEVVALNEMHRIDPAWEGCGEGQTLFLRPIEALDAGETYTLSIATDADPGGKVEATFTVGDSAFEPEPQIDLQPLYLLTVRPEMPCELACRIGSVSVDFGSAPAMPRWLAVTSGATEHGRNQWDFSPEYVFEGMEVPEWTIARQISVLLPADDDCVDIELFGVEGRSLFQERRCVPDRCASSGIFGFGDCGDPPSSAVDASEVPPDSCDESPVLTVTPGVGLESPDAGAAVVGAAGVGAAEDAGRRRTEPPNTVEAQHPEAVRQGCRIRAPGAGGDAPSWPAFAGLLYVGRRARRRRN